MAARDPAAPSASRPSAHRASAAASSDRPPAADQAAPSAGAPSQAAPPQVDPSGAGGAGATSAQLRADIDSGRMGDKIAWPDPAASPLGTDDEAAGVGPSPELVARARAAEMAQGDAAGPSDARADHARGYAFSDARVSGVGPTRRGEGGHIGSDPATGPRHSSRPLIPAMVVIVLVVLAVITAALVR